MAMRSTRLASLVAVTVLAAGLCAACGTVGLPLVGSGTDSGNVPAAAKPALAVPAIANATPTPNRARSTSGAQPIAVTRGSIAEVLSLDGVVAPQDQTSLTFQWKAIVDNVAVKAGRSVKQGDVLIDFSPGDVPKALDDARVRLQASQVTLAQTKARQQTAA